MGKKAYKITFKVKLYKIELLIFGGIIFFLNIWNINDYSGIMNGVDEYGYLSNAVFLIGKDVDPIAHTLSYYSFGYSFLLCPLVKFISNPESLIRAIICLNSFFVVLAFCFVTKSCLKVHRDLKPEVVTFFSFIGFFYVSNYVYSKFVFTECLLTLLITLVVYLFVWLLEDFKTFKLFCLYLITIYMYFVHQRTVVVLLTVVLFTVLFLIKRDISIKQFLCILFFSFAMLGIGIVLKNVFVSKVYTDSNRVALNNYSGQVSKLDYLLNIEGIWNFILQYLAKIYYFSFATLFCGPIAVFYGIKNVFNYKWEKRSYYYLFLFILFLGIFTLQSFFLQGPIYRYDVVVYGRYAEYFYPFLFCEGLICIFSSKKRKDVLNMSLWSYGITIIGIISARNIFENNGLLYYRSYLCPALFCVYDVNKDLNSGLLLSLLFSSSFFLIFILWKNSEKILSILICILFVALQLVGIIKINNNFCDNQKVYSEKNSDFISCIDAIDANVFFLLDNTDNYQKYRRLQYRLNRSKLEGIYINDLITDTIEGYIIIDYTEREVLEKIGSRKLVYDNDGFSLWYIGD